jgi:hypothetical protein
LTNIKLFLNTDYSKQPPKLNQKLGFKHLRDFLHIFVDMDRNHDGFLSYDDFYVRYYSNVIYFRYEHILTKKDIQNYFVDLGKTI